MQFVCQDVTETEKERHERRMEGLTSEIMQAHIQFSPWFLPPYSHRLSRENEGRNIRVTEKAPAFKALDEMKRYGFDGSEEHPERRFLQLNRGRFLESKAPLPDRTENQNRRGPQGGSGVPELPCRIHSSCLGSSWRSTSQCRMPSTGLSLLFTNRKEPATKLECVGLFLHVVEYDTWTCPKLRFGRRPRRSQDSSPTPLIHIASHPPLSCLSAPLNLSKMVSRHRSPEARLPPCPPPFPAKTDDETVTAR